MMVADNDSEIGNVLNIAADPRFMKTDFHPNHTQSNNDPRLRGDGGS